MRGSINGSVVVRASQNMKQHQPRPRAARFAVLLLLCAGCDPIKDAEVGVYDVQQHIGAAGNAAPVRHPTPTHALGTDVDVERRRVLPGRMRGADGGRERRPGTV